MTTSPPTRPRLRLSRLTIFGVLLLAGLGAAGALFLARLNHERVKITSQHMIPTLKIGGVHEVNKKAYQGHEPAAGDIVAFRFPRDESVLMVSRIVAIPGDTVELRNHLLYVNGARVDQDPVPGETQRDEDGRTLRAYPERIGNHSFKVFYDADSHLNDEFRPVAIPPGHYFVLGDNRDRSSDSRIWGLLPRASILGQIDE